MKRSQQSDPSRRTWPFTRWLSICCVLSACGGQSSTDNGGRTHWLRACQEDAECGTGLCWQEHCTAECDEQETCSELSSNAICSLSAPLPSSFESTCPLSTGHAVCLPTCTTDAGCASVDDVCAQGVCVPATCAESDLVKPGPLPASPGIWLTAALEGGAGSAVGFEQAVAAYTRDPNNRVLVSIVATNPDWGSVTLNVVSNPGPVSNGEYPCTTGASFVSATMLTATGILSFTSDSPPSGSCTLIVLEPGEAVGAPFSGTFNATLVASTGDVLILSDGQFRGTLNE